MRKVRGRSGLRRSSRVLRAKASMFVLIEVLSRTVLAIYTSGPPEPGCCQGCAVPFRAVLFPSGLCCHSALNDNPTVTACRRRVQAVDAACTHLFRAALPFCTNRQTKQRTNK